MTHHLQPDGAALIERVAQRDQQALTELYALHGRAVFNMAHYVLRDRSTAEEVMQDVFLQVWRWPERYDPARGRLLTWLLAITRYTAIDRLRREQRQPPVAAPSLDTLGHLLGERMRVDDPNWDNGRLLKKLLLQLPKDQRQAITMAFFRGMTHSQIAEQLGEPLGTIKSRIRLGLRRLKEGWLEALQETPQPRKQEI